MSIRKIEKKEWQEYFNSFSKKFLKDEQPEYAEVRILNKSMGVQPETQWTLLKGVTYDKKGDVLEIQLEKLNRMVHHPQEIYVDEADDGWLLSFEIVQNDGTRNIIETR
ncbi:DUF5335 family protein [Fodinibius salsisoli]|uniref:DUF5335 family protein n=1 Tax=Fodinibius salsisoli TaxID=2820877 RepID=A0ABT3PJ22_9BACT|nr:DUF5335 family protein [Fodinibius salsisoli]MCW9705880.1 DUF5335 family protein [Fodinibius salsisoli]